MISSETQRARFLYQDIRDEIHPEDPASVTPGLYRHNGSWVWVSHGERAYKVKDLSDSHLSNTIIAMRQRHANEYRKPLVTEYLKRRFLLKWRPDRAPKNPLAN